MKVKRHKHIKKTLAFYKNHFNICPPYNILVDGTFCKAALTWKLNIQDQLPKYFESECKLFTTKCAVAECEVFGSLLFGPLKILRGYDVQPCRHDTPIQAGKCLYNTARQQQDMHFILATCDQELSEKVNSSRGVPLLYISHSAIILQSPSEASMKAAENLEADRLAIPSQKQQDFLDALTKKEFGTEKTDEKKRKRKRKGQNPLSCKKKKVGHIETPNANTENGSKKRSRKRHKKKNKAANFNV